MRYHFEKPENYSHMYGKIYICNHPVYNRCTLYLIGKIDPWLVDALYLNEGFKKFFDDRAGECEDNLYPTVTIRQIMWALKMKPLKRERWETCFDRRNI